MSKKRKKYRLWKRYLDTEDGEIYTEYRRCSNQLRNMTRKLTKHYEKNLAKSAKSNPKKFWKYVNSKKTVKSQIPDLYQSDDENPDNMARTDKEKSERLASFFSGLGARGLHDVWNISNKPEVKEELEVEIVHDNLRVSAGCGLNQPEVSISFSHARQSVYVLHNL